mgnify:FL=1
MAELHNSFVCKNCKALLSLEKFHKKKVGGKVIILCPICHSNKVVPALVAIKDYCESICAYVRNIRNIWNLTNKLLNSCEYMTNIILELDNNDIYIPEEIIENLIDIEAQADYLISALLKIGKRSEFLMDNTIRFCQKIIDLLEKLSEINAELKKACSLLMQVENLVKKMNKIKQYIEKKRKILDLGIKLPNGGIERIVDVIRLNKTNLVLTNLSLIIVSQKKIIRASLNDVKVKLGRFSSIIVYAGKKKVRGKVKNPDHLLEEITKLISYAKGIRIINIKELLEERQLIKLHNWKDLRNNVLRLSEKFQQMMNFVRDFLHSKSNTKEKEIKYSIPYKICS